MQTRGRLTDWNARSRSDSAGAPAHPTTGSPSRPTTLIASAALTTTILLAALGAVGWFVPGAYFVMSLVAFAAYGADKSAAEAGGWRTSEGTLIGIGLLGGWPGALIAQECFRHKTRKQPFRTVFFVSIAFNIAILVWIAVATRSGVLS